MSNDDIERIAAAAAEAAADRTVRELLTTLGVDTSSPQSIIQVQVDLAYLRRQRQASERIAAGVRWAILTTVVTGFLSVAWLGLQAALKQ